MRFSISTAMYTPDTGMEEIARRVRRAGYDSVDLNLYDFCGEDGPMRRTNWREWVREIRRCLEDGGLAAVQVHAALGIFAPDEFAFHPPGEIIFRNLEACGLLGCREIVFHPVLYREVLDSVEKRASLMEYNARWFRSLIPAARQAGVTVSIENLFDRRKQEFPPLFCDIGSIKALLREIGGDCFGICLDTGHAHIMGLQAAGLARECGGLLKTLHLHDNLGSIEPVFPDLHGFPGSGSIDFPAFFQALREIGYQGAVNLEPSEELVRLSPAIRDALIAGARKVVEAFAMG